jgi:glycosyltransferase involved in cell wall biosynthesis
LVGGLLSKIKLCMLAPEFFPIWGGTGSYIVELVKNMPSSIDVHVLTLKREIQGASKKEVDDEIASVIRRPVKVHYISESKETFFYNLSFQLACFRKLPALHKEYRFDIIHSHLCHMPDVFLKLFNMSFTSFPTVLTLHGTIQMLRDHAFHARALFGDLESGEESTLLFFPLIRLLEQQYVKRVSKLIAVSKATKELAQKYLKVDEEKIETIYNGVDTEIFRPPNKIELANKYAQPTVMFVGRMISKKGIHVLIKAMPEVLERVPKTHFVFVGGGDVQLYRTIIKQMGIPDDNFSFTGHIGYYQRPQILRKATVFVNPSLFENCSLSILEAMSSNAAIIASNIGGNPEIIQSGKNGILFPMCNHGTLAESIISLLTDEKLNRQISREARKTIENCFSSKICAQKTLNLYEQILH